jgi:adenosylcobinamide-GDP ribazoletransferase
MQFIRHFLLALQYFTRIPMSDGLARWVGFSATMQQASLAHFPGIGCLVGALSGLTFYVFALLLPTTSATPWIAACLSTVVSVMLTGAFHEDGLADTSDGLGGVVTRERALEIMKDSRIGSYGGVALMLTLSTKLGLLTMLGQLDFVLAAWCLFAAHVCSRFMSLLITVRLRNVGDDLTTKTKPLANKTPLRTLGVALIWLLLADVAFSSQFAPSLLLWATGCSSIAWLLMLRLLSRRLNGFTGDTLGATQQVCELAFYLGVLVGFAR